jgi:hypothetical protein
LSNDLTFIQLGKNRLRGGLPAFGADAQPAIKGAAYWFTASTSIANPAVTIARTLSDTFAAIRPDRRAGFHSGAIGSPSLGSSAPTSMRGKKLIIRQVR